MRSCCSPLWEGAVSVGSIRGRHLALEAAPVEVWVQARNAQRAPGVLLGLERACATSRRRMAPEQAVGAVAGETRRFSLEGRAASRGAVACSRLQSVDGPSWESHCQDGIKEVT